MVSSLSLGHRKFPLKLRRNTNVERRWWLENILNTFQEVQTLLVAVGNHQLPQSCLLLDLEAEEREEYAVAAMLLWRMSYMKTTNKSSSWTSSQRVSSPPSSNLVPRSLLLSLFSMEIGSIDWKGNRILLQRMHIRQRTTRLKGSVVLESNSWKPILSNRNIYRSLYLAI